MRRSILAFIAVFAVLTSAVASPLLLLGVSVGAASGTFPTVQATATTNTCTGVSTCSVNLPTGITSGDLLLACAFEADGRAISNPTGWSGVLWQDTTIGSGAGGCIYKLPASGSEGSTVSVSVTGGTTAFSWIAFRISPASAITNATVSNGDQDPPNLAPAGGSADYLWIEYVGGRYSSAPTWTASTNYSGVTQANNAGGNSATAALAYRQLTASSEDPAAWTNTGSVNATSRGANTMAVTP